MAAAIAETASDLHFTFTIERIPQTGDNPHVIAQTADDDALAT